MVRSSPGPHRLVAMLDHSLHDRALVGGKGASLSQLFALGAPVPVACALTTSAYLAFASSAGVPPNVVTVRPEELPALRQSILDSPLPADIDDAIRWTHASLLEVAGDGLALAVRSSATTEDSAEFSFAGLHDTVLDVRSLSTLEAAVRVCWASLWSDRAVGYRRASGLAAEPAEIAVVIQQMVRSDVSFVVFTADPVSGDGGHAVISASWGLGEAVVSGIVTPDHIVVDASGDIVEYAVGRKERMVIPGAHAGDGAREVAVPRALQSQASVTPSQAAAIAAMARQISGRLGYHADIEGGISGGSIYLFQARPITTLGREPSVSITIVGDGDVGAPTGVPDSTAQTISQGVTMP